MKAKNPARRQFLKRSAAMAGGLSVAPSIVSQTNERDPVRLAQAGDAGSDPINSVDAVLYGRRSRFVTTVRHIEGSSSPDGSPPRPSPYRPSVRTPVGDLTGIITPTSLHFATQHFYGVPDIDPERHRLMVHGMVDRPLVFTMDELQRLPSVSRVHFIECVGNRPNPRGRTAADTHGRMGCSEWTGVPLSVLLNEVGVKDGAKWIVAEGSDGGKHAKSVPIAKALDDVMVAYGQNGEPVRPDHGFPLRLLVPGMEGIYQVKWLRRIKVVDQPYLTFQESSRFLHDDPRTQPNTYELGPKSVITSPSGGQRLPSPGIYTVTGLAWSGAGAIRAVEVSTDGGRSYQSAELSGPSLPRAFTRFHFPWTWDGQETVLQSRCVDERNQRQPSEAEFLEYWGMTRQELYRASNTRLGHCNWIQAWKVEPRGDVVNGLLPVNVEITDVHRA